jgi:hypothetical protein
MNRGGRRLSSWSTTCRANSAVGMVGVLPLIANRAETFVRKGLYKEVSGMLIEVGSDSVLLETSPGTRRVTCTPNGRSSMSRVSVRECRAALEEPEIPPQGEALIKWSKPSLYDRRGHSHLSCYRADVDDQATASCSHVGNNRLDQAEDVEDAEGKVTLDYVYRYIEQCT